MALERNELLSLMKAAAQATSKRNYSYKGVEMTSYALNETLRDELKALAGDFNSYRRNQVELFELVEQTIDDIVPQRLQEAYSQFANFKVFRQGEKPIFKVRGLGRMRAKQFITRVGLAGLYETFKLSDTWFEVQTSAIGGAVNVGFEEFLDGRVDFAELVQLVMEGMDELIYKEIANALISSVNQLPENNVIEADSFEEASMDQLVAIASAYGTPTIYCTRQFAAEMLPSGTSGWLSEAMKDGMWNVGYLTVYKGVRVVILPNSVEDETNTRFAIDPSYAWVIAGEAKPINVAYEGGVHMKDIEAYDWSHEIHFYQKVGVAAIMTNNVCVYHNNELSADIATMYGTKD